MNSKLSFAYPLLPHEVLRAVRSFVEQDKIDEIRLRAGGKVSLTVSGKDMLLDLRTGPEDVMNCFKTAFSYSLHSHPKELRQGSITTQGGNRVGFCGKAVIENDRVESVCEISSVNIRIAREIFGVSDEIVGTCFSERPCGLLVIGPPSTGKTTLLRDISRVLGEKYSVSLIDERGELSAMYDGVPQNSVGSLTDVFFLCPKSEGIETAVRSMSPKIIIADEIFGQDDVKALFYAVNSGVKIITAVHGVSLEQVSKKPGLDLLTASGAFEYAVILSENRKSEVVKIV